MKDYNALDELVPKTQELHRAIFDKGYEQGQKDALGQQLIRNGEWLRMSDALTVCFYNELEDEPALCVSRKCGEKTIILKMELGEQADILYHLLIEQMTKAEIKADKENK